MSTSRRTFCAAVGSAAVTRAADAKIRVAVIGTGHGHAASKVRSLRTLPEFDFVGVCRPDRDEPAENEAFRGVRWLELDEILRDPTIEMVAVESMPTRNLAYAQRCVSAGKFVHLDKPPGTDLAAFRAMLDEAAQRKRVVQLGYQWRYHPGMQAAIAAARQGWLGQVHRARLWIDKSIGAEERRELALFRGGVLFTEGCHLVDRVIDLFGKPIKTTAFFHHESPIADGLADNTLAVFEYPRAIAEISIASFQPNGGSYRRFEIVGSNGEALVEPYAPVQLIMDLVKPAGPYKAGRQVIEPGDPFGYPYGPDFQEMARIIRKGEQPSYSAQHDLLVQQTLLEVCGMLPKEKS